MLTLRIENMLFHKLPLLDRGGDGGSALLGAAISLAQRPDLALVRKRRLCPMSGRWDGGLTSASDGPASCSGVRVLRLDADKLGHDRRIAFC